MVTTGCVTDLAPTPETRNYPTIEQIEAFTKKIHSGAIHPPKHLDSQIFFLVLVVQPGPQFVAEALAPDFTSRILYRQHRSSWH